MIYGCYQFKLDKEEEQKYLWFSALIDIIRRHLIHSSLFSMRMGCYLALSNEGLHKERYYFPHTYRQIHIRISVLQNVLHPLLITECQLNNIHICSWFLMLTMPFFPSPNAHHYWAHPDTYLLRFQGIGSTVIWQVFASQTQLSVFLSSKWIWQLS